MIELSHMLNWIDRKSGLANASTLHAERVRAAQLRGVIDMAPIASVGALFAMSVMIAVLHDTEYLTEALIISALIAIFQLLSLKTFFEFKKSGGPKAVRRKVLKKVALSGAIFGALWGALGVLAVSQAEPSRLFIVGILMGGILLTSIYCFRTVLLGAMSFTVVSGIFLGIAFWSRPEFIGSAAAIALLVCYFTLMPRIAFTQMCDFVGHCMAELKSADDAQISDALLKQFEEAGDEWFWATNSDGFIERASLDLRNLLAHADPEFRDAQTPKRLSDCDVEASGGLAAAFSSGEDFKSVRVPIDINQKTHWISFSGQRSVSEEGHFGGFVGVCMDVTKEQVAEEKILEMAMRDGLTGLHNRTAFYEALDHIVRRLERYGTPFTLLFLDLDKFKLVNDTYGHHVGDALLREASKRLKHVLRDNDIVGRLGGDEFAIIVEETCDPVFIAKLAARIIQEVAAPYHVEGETLFIGVSAGVALAPMHGTQREQLLRNADLALYRAKDDGRGVFRYFESQMDFEQRERRMLEQEMRQALLDDEFEMKFQPMISTRTGDVACMEALIRWNHEIRGLLSPDEFISIAEQSNLIVEVGRWSLQSACRTAVTWPEHISVAVNISALHFMRSNIVADVEEVLKETGIKASRLEVEITESILIEDNDETLTKLNGLRALGVTIAMDDFGTGYSSLGYLTRFRFDRLKIDKSFLLDMEADENRRAIVYTISTLGKNLGIKITVEGVETLEHVQFLKSIHCDQAQGYYYSRPLSKENVPAFLLKNFSEAVALPDERITQLADEKLKAVSAQRKSKVA